MTKKLESRVAIVTGSARGLGVALAEQFAADGASILLVDKSGEELADVARRARECGSPEVAHTAQELATEQGAAEVIALALRTWGKIDILVNNAGGGLIRPPRAESMASRRALRLNLSDRALP